MNKIIELKSIDKIIELNILIIILTRIFTQNISIIILVQNKVISNECFKLDE